MGFLKDEGGFSMIELMIYVAIVGILLSIAVPKYNNALTTANTAKLQADLQTIDTAINMYYLENGKYPDSIADDLGDYISNVNAVVPPVGKCSLQTGDLVDITAEEYTLSDDGSKALCQGYAATAFGKHSKVTKDDE